MSAFLPCPWCDAPLHLSQPCRGPDDDGCEGEDCPICDGGDVWYDDAPPAECSICGVVSRVKVVDADEVYAEEVGPRPPEVGP